MNTRTKYALAGLVGTGVLAALFVFWSVNGPSPSWVPGGAGSGDKAITATTKPEMYAAVFGSQPPGAIPVFVTGLENLPPSLAGTEVDGALEIDPDGHLKVANPVRRLFDYFLTAVGEEPLDTVLARLRAYIRHTLPPGAAAEAEKMLGEYLSYKEALVGVQGATQAAGGVFDEAAVRASLQGARALREDHMPAGMAEAFYADEDAMNDYLLDRVAILREGGLDATERARRLAEREGQLPARLREATHVLNQYRDLQSLTEEWKRNSGSPAALRQIRENLLGAEAADRLEELDRNRSDWNARFDNWMAERQRLRDAKGLDESDRRQQLDSLRRAHFSEEEQLRVEALERIADEARASGRSVPLAQ